MEKSLISHLSVVHRNLKELWIRVGGVRETGTNLETGKNKERKYCIHGGIYLLNFFYYAF